MSSIPPILKLDITGSPTSWISYTDAVRLWSLDRVIANLGSERFLVQGGINARSGQRSSVQIASIILTRGRSKISKEQRKFVPHLTNRALFRRDAHVCLYCGEQFSSTHLTRDHVIPLSRGGHDTWENVVTACFRCNNQKGNQTLEEWGRYELIAVPYVPNKAEYLYLQNRKIIADQQAFLMARFSRHGRLKLFTNTPEST